MKKNIYLCLLAVLVLSFSCSNDDILLDETSSNLEQENNQKGSEDDSSNLNQSKAPINGARTQANPMGDSNGDEVYILYLDMDLLEAEYNSDSSNPSYSGPFNLFYRNLMSSHFTIYNIHVSTNFACGNIERWYVNLDELNLYLTSIGLPEVSNDNNDEEDSNNTGGGNTSNTSGISGSNSKGKDNPPDPDDINEPLNIILLNYSHCFQ